jgi:hypothetical protein
VCACARDAQNTVFFAQNTVFFAQNTVFFDSSIKICGSTCENIVSAELECIFTDLDKVVVGACGSMFLFGVNAWIEGHILASGSQTSCAPLLYH